MVGIRGMDMVMSCQDEEAELAPEYIAFGSLVFLRLSSDRLVGEDAGIQQDGLGGDPGLLPEAVSEGSQVAGGAPGASSLVSAASAAEGVCSEVLLQGAGPVERAGLAGEDLGHRTVDVLWEEPLGCGAFGKVYKGVYYPEGKFCAIKTSKICGAGLGDSRASSDVDGARMLEDEAALLSQLKHTNILACYGLFQHDTLQCAALEFCGDGDLLAHLQRQQDCFPVVEVRMFMQQLLSAVTYLCGRSVVHRDIKPANLLLSGFETDTGSGTLKIADFGLAAYLHLGKDELHQGWGGTIPYESPEQLTGHFDCASDVWASGMVFYELLRGRMLVPDQVWMSGASAVSEFLGRSDFARLIDGAGVHLAGPDEAVSLLRSMLTINRSARARAVDLFDHAFFAAKQPTSGYACLPDGWSQYWDVNHEAWYFIEKQSGACTWEVPERARLKQKKPLLVVLPVDDLRHCGLSSRDAEEARLSAVIGSVASDFLVPDLFPKMPEHYWADDWHFTEQGARVFSIHLAKNLKQYLVSLGRYKEGMRVHAVSDSTIDFLDWDHSWKWVGKGDVVFKEGFAQHGFVLTVDVAGSTGFCLSTKSACSFPDRLRKRREASAASGRVEAFDCVLVIGGYNDVYARRSVSEDMLRSGVLACLDECALLLQSSVSGPLEADLKCEDDSEQNQRVFGYVPLERGERASYHQGMLMGNVLCSEPREFTLQDDEDWDFWGELSWLEIAKAIFVQASVLRYEYAWNVNKCKKREAAPFKRLCENAMWLHEQQSALPHSMQDLRKALDWDTGGLCVFDRLCRLSKLSCKKCGEPGDFWRLFKKLCEPLSPECREVWCSSCYAKQAFVAGSVGNRSTGCYGSIVDINELLSGPVHLSVPESHQEGSGGKGSPMDHAPHRIVEEHRGSQQVGCVEYCDDRFSNVLSTSSSVHSKLAKCFRCVESTLAHFGPVAVSLCSIHVLSCGSVLDRPDAVVCGPELEGEVLSVCLDDDLSTPLGAATALRPCMDPECDAVSSVMITVSEGFGVVSEVSWEVQQELHLVTGEILCDLPPVPVPHDADDGDRSDRGAERDVVDRETREEDDEAADDSGKEDEGDEEEGEDQEFLVLDRRPLRDNADWSPIALSRLQVEAMTVLSFVQVERSGRLRHPVSGWTCVDADLDAQLPAIREFAREACFPPGLVTEVAWGSQQESSGEGGANDCNGVCAGDDAGSDDRDHEEQGQDEGMSFPSYDVLCGRSQSGCCPHEGITCSGCGTVMSNDETVGGACCECWFRDCSSLDSVDAKNSVVCCSVLTEASPSMSADGPCQVVEWALPVDEIGWGSLVYPRMLVGENSVDNDVEKVEDSSRVRAGGVRPGAIDAGPCYLSSICRSRASFAAAERWFGKEQLAAGSFKQDADRSKFYRAVDSFESGVIDKDQYETLVVSALCLRRWWGFVDQISVVHAWKLENDVCVGASLETMAGSSPGLTSRDVGSDGLINLIVGGVMPTIVEAVVAPERDLLQLKRGRAAAVRRQSRRQARRRACRQARRQARGEAMQRSEKRRKEAGKRHERGCREAMKREQIWLCLSYFCVLFRFHQPRQSLAKRLTKKRRQSQPLDARPPCVVSGVADVKKSQDHVVHESHLRNVTASRHTGWVGRRWLGVAGLGAVGGCRWVAGSRWVGCRRYACARCSPGCGVNRRRRCVQSLSEIRSSVSESISVSHHSRVGRTRERDAISRFAGALRSGDVWPESCGSRLGIWRRKCLQRVIIHCCKGRMRYDAECWFGQRCQNNVGSGCGHSQVEARNFREALSFLLSQKCYVRVFASATQQRFSLGDACGGWQLGDSGGRCVGGVVWFVAEQHAMRLRGEWESL